MIARAITTGIFTRATEPKSERSAFLAEGVLKVMILAKLYRAILGTAAASGLLSLAWLVHVHQAIADPPQAEAPAAAQKTTGRTVDLDGNWIVRGYPSGQAFGLIKIEGSPPQAHATLLSVTTPDHVAESKVDRLRIDGKTLRFTLQLQSSRPVHSQTAEVIAYLPADQPTPKALWGSMEWDGQGQYPAKLERTDRKEIDRQEGMVPAPGSDVLREFNETDDPAKQKEIGRRMLDKFGDTPMAVVAGSTLALSAADAGAPETEVRASIDRAARLAARYGREMEVGAINQIVQYLVGMAKQEDVVLDYARKAVAMQQPSDPVNLQKAALKNLAKALRKVHQD